MKDTPLAREWRCSTLGQDMPAAFRADLRALWDSIDPGIWRDLISAGPVLIEGEAYQPHEDGQWCFLTPVLRVDLEMWCCLVWDCRFDPGVVWDEIAEVVDIVAWHPATPGRWARRTGLADMLGEVAADEPVRVHRTPLAWLRAGGEGVCFLERNLTVVSLALNVASQVIAEDKAHARELREICERPYPVPRIQGAA